MPTKHRTSAAGLTGGAKIGQPEWDDTHIIDSLDLTGLASDPGSPSNGTLWFNSAAGRFIAREGGVSLPILGQASVPALKPPAGEWIYNSTAGWSTAAAGFGTDQASLAPWVCPFDVTLSDIGINVSTAGLSGALSKFAIYDSDASGKPNSRLFMSGTVPVDTTGFKSTACTLSLAKGKTYWFMVRASLGFNSTSWNLACCAPINGGTTGSTSNRTILTRTIAFATDAPATWVWSGAEASAVTASIIGLKVAA